MKKTKLDPNSQEYKEIVQRLLGREVVFTPVLSLPPLSKKSPTSPLPPLSKKVSKEEKLKNKIRDAMKEEIKARLKESFSNKKISEFLTKNSDNLEKAVKEMYDAYREDDELDDLENAERDWYNEYLYEYVSLPEPVHE